MYRSVLAIAIVLAGTAAASAHETRRHDGIDRRQANQAHRIEQGRRTGQLTVGEYRRLKMQQHRIAVLERRAKADGRVTPAERRRMQMALHRASERIARLRHNERKANWR